MSSSASAPAEVLLIRDFVNSYEPQVDDETLASPKALRDWFAGRGLLPARARLDAADLAAATTVREGLRAILLGHGGHAVDEGAIAAGNRILAELPIRLELGADGYRMLPAGSGALDPALIGLLDAIRRAKEQGTWVRLKVCDRTTCRWAYYDTSRNQSRRWCSMTGCGNHIKMRRAYAARTGRAEGRTN
ncbi:CGNR zinc finger domain-containing protein [Microlunatus parietis]|uniref:Putative RNA-binding Zn ribbon-like protein n=1 Tax=Microlunatus parietis TaxID=682979 RepID=A0A7Y9I6C8_9ACTN|nr:CGNR zinc finger domain-containing protein [Microlunatus parietis]NYE71107.1 putative RNA-binding Zn ribbon-like protein [Microlunatus parietis]